MSSVPARDQTQKDRLREQSIGVPQVLFQAITHMGPAAAVAFSLLLGFTYAGPAMPLSVGLTVFVVLFIAVAVGQLARHLPSAGGLYTYTSRALGAPVGFLVGWMSALLELVVAPTICMVLGLLTHETVASSFGVEHAWWNQWYVWTLLAFSSITVLNYVGVRLATDVGIILGIVELLVFLALAVTMIVNGPLTVQTFDPSEALQGGWGGVFKGVVFSILAFQGFETSAALGEEARNPRRTVVFGVLGSGLIIGVFYLICSYSAVVGWGFDKMASYASSADPWHALAVQFWGVGWVAIFLAIINSAVGNGNGGMIAATRIVYAMGRVHALPKAFGRTHPRFLTPHVAIGFQFLFGVGMSMGLGLSVGPFNGFSIMATVLTVLVILVYILTCLSAPVLYLREHRDEINPLLTVVLPVAGALIMLAPLYYQFAQPPDYPIRAANWVALVWIGLGIVVLVYLRMRRPESFRSADKVFLHEEV
jgi:amino acid transporter